MVQETVEMVCQMAGTVAVTVEVETDFPMADMEEVELVQAVAGIHPMADMAGVEAEEEVTAVADIHPMAVTDMACLMAVVVAVAVVVVVVVDSHIIHPQDLLMHHAHPVYPR